jgi:hypothetical protein
MGASGAFFGGGSVLVSEPIMNLIDRERVDRKGLMKRTVGSAIAGGLIGAVSE